MSYSSGSSPPPNSDPHGLKNKGFRLAIHLLCGMVFTALFRNMINTSRLPGLGAGDVQTFTEVWLQGNFAMWAISFLLPDRWLTPKRVAVGIPLLNLLAFWALLRL